MQQCNEKKKHNAKKVYKKKQNKNSRRNRKHKSKFEKNKKRAEAATVTLNRSIETNRKEKRKCNTEIVNKRNSDSKPIENCIADLIFVSYTLLLL